MQTAKQAVTELLQHLPDDSTLEDIQYHLYALEKIRKGRDDTRADPTATRKPSSGSANGWRGNLVGRSAGRY